MSRVPRQAGCTEQGRGALLEHERSSAGPNSNRFPELRRANLRPVVTGEGKPCQGVMSESGGDFVCGVLVGVCVKKHHRFGDYGRY